MTAPRPDRTGSAGHVDVWLVGLDLPAAAVAELARTLSDDEAARAARFHFERDARRFIVARGRLRQLLGAYLAVAPPEVRFVYGARGKPALAPSLDSSGVRFNLSHSGEVALYAIGRHQRIGVDIEQLRPLDDLEPLAARNFSAAECHALFSVPSERRTSAFFACWTRKEAYVKAVGDGLAHPLQAFTVGFEAGQPAGFLQFADDPEAAEQWTLQAVDVPPGYAAAVAVDGPATVTTCGAWPLPSSTASGVS